ncbi:MAG: DUF4124 domain-containing protein [Oryzomonas sp.]|uniref:DUF4124 domain-containing protein n=1 Tax=Oryzomonas sp. TaxID=2855186 RepID=UPI00284A69B3|nr:DUF4124 domain-containing protein [Oryzomonas sp.]MDR3581162.1 DUF4124 domain-containing protein [Oryzomonas sp.]
MKKILLMLLLAASVAHAETYEWTDREGTVHFSDTRAEIPALYRKSATPLGMDTVTTANSGRAVPAATSGQGADAGGSIAPQVEQLKERMQNDKGTMSLVRALLSDPQMQAILDDPAVLRAAQAGDFGALLNNPDVMKLLSNPKVQEIGERMQQGGTK